MQKLHHSILNLPAAVKITVCSGSNTAHVAATYLGSKPGYVVNVLTRSPSLWSHNLTIQTENTSWEQKGLIEGYITTITDDPSTIIPESDIILISAPAHTHKAILQKIVPYIQTGQILGCLYCQGGFDWAVRSVLKTNVQKLDGIFGLLNIPWICKAIVYGKASQLYGPKKKLYLTSWPLKHAKHYALIVSLLFDIPTITVPNFISLTLTPSNQIIHPARYYAMFHDWDGVTPIPKENIQWGLYTEFDDTSAYWLEQLDLELQSIKQSLQQKFPKLDLSNVLPIADRIILHYGEDVKDSTNLKSIFNTNIGYAGCRTPVNVINETTVTPALNSRLFWEDIPYGLCILKSIAQMLTIQTPAINKMILWHQKFMKKEYLVESTGKLNQQIIHETGAPEAHGITDIESLVAFSLD